MSQHTPLRAKRWAALALPLLGVMAFTACSAPSGGGGNGSSGGGFSLMVPEASGSDDYYSKTAEAYTKETGVPIEVIPYPLDAYYTQVRTQLQGGNAADVMIVQPGAGLPTSISELAGAGFLAPLGAASVALIPAGSESQFQVNGETYAQPTSLIPAGMVLNTTAASESGLEYPESYDDLLATCATARDEGKSFAVLAGSTPFNTGQFALVIAATQVYAQTPDWNEQRVAGDVTFADSGWSDVLQSIVDMNDAGCFQDGAAGGTFDSITSGLGAGSSFTAAVPGGAVALLNASTGSDFDVHAFPPADGEKAYALTGANYGWGINAAADDSVKTSAQEFLDWLATPEQSAAFAELSGEIPISGIDASTLLPSYEPIGELLAGGDFIPSPNNSWPNASVYDALGVGVQGLLTGQKTIDQVLDDMDAAWGA